MLLKNDPKCLSLIWYLGSGFFFRPVSCVRIPDPKVKKALDPGSGTLSCNYLGMAGQVAVHVALLIEAPPAEGAQERLLP